MGKVSALEPNTIISLLVLVGYLAYIMEWPVWVMTPLGKFHSWPLKFGRFKVSYFGISGCKC